MSLSSGSRRTFSLYFCALHPAFFIWICPQSSVFSFVSVRADPYWLFTSPIGPPRVSSNPRTQRTNIAPTPQT